MAGGLNPAALTAIDWSAPWLVPWRIPGEAIAARVATGVPQARALQEAGPCPVRFVPQNDLPAGVAYECYIFHSGCCPTREGLHDFFNGLAWLRFPRTKTRLNQLHMAQIACNGIAAERGPVRDAITVFDENAALLCGPDALWQALCAKDWPQLFGPLRPLWGQTRLWLFGHALLEKLVQPRKAITAHVYRAFPATESIADMDAWLAADLNAEKLAGKPFAPLPVLGVPGWCAANAEPRFYADAHVFRAAPATLGATTAA